MEKCAAISTGPLTHLDHLAPLCYLLNAPLIVTDSKHYELGKKFYPMVDLQYIAFEDLSLEYLAKAFDQIIGCGKFWAMELKPLLEMLYNKKMRFIFSPHGNSDKESFLDQVADQDIDLVYGPQMARMRKGHAVEMGNIRRWFYEEHKIFFDAITSSGVFHRCDPNKKTILYAPTWETKATTSSFFHSVGPLIEELGKEYNLLIKLHPLLEENNPALFYKLLGKYEEEAHFVLDFPLIYPLLEKSSIYIGDFSSIGYDFLYYNRPMFFIQAQGRLAQCGEPYLGRQCLDNEQIELSKIKRELYLDAFGEIFNGGKIKTLLEETSRVVK